MESLEVHAKTVEEATRQALGQLGLTRDAVEVVVVKEGRGGILGLGAEDAVVRVTPLAEQAKPQGADVEKAARDVVEELLRLLGVSASIETQVRPETAAGEAGEAAVAISFDIKGEDLGVLIGRRGQTLASLQYVVRLLVGRRTNSWVPIVIDVEGYKQRRYKALETFAKEMAARVKARGAPFTLEPMPPYERRIIHLSLANSPDVVTESIGQGDERKVVIRPKKK